MSDELIFVSIHLHQSGQLKAFADFTLQTPLGEITIRGFRVVQKDGGEPWIAFPAMSYQKDGEAKFKDLLDMPQATHRKIAEAILAEYRRVSEGN